MKKPSIRPSYKVSVKFRYRPPVNQEVAQDMSPNWTIATKIATVITLTGVVLTLCAIPFLRRPQ